MPGLGLDRPTISRLVFSATALAVVVGVFGFARAGLGSALVGETRRIDIGLKAPIGIDAMKALYRRPASIPFPKGNPYTPQKVLLGKKLYFDTRLSATSASLARAVTVRGLAGGMDWHSESDTAWRSWAGARRPSFMPPGEPSSCGTAGWAISRSRHSAQFRRPAR